MWLSQVQTDLHCMNTTMILGEIEWQRGTAPSHPPPSQVTAQGGEFWSQDARIHPSPPQGHQAQFGQQHPARRGLACFIASTAPPGMGKPPVTLKRVI